MSREYDLYLESHKTNVRKAFEWIQDNLPECCITIPNVDYEHQICFDHDTSKTEPDEYEAYDAHFYGNNRSYDVEKKYRIAWVKHLNRNPHHWQYWVLINDDPKEGMIVLDMPYNYILEMICDWWAFSWNKGNLKEIFAWYNEHKEYMKLSKYTRSTVESILAKIDHRLTELEGES
ncbi:MAG: hypothetical protein J6B01_04405 [Ruminococcus sp.]|nr:hypothetical protein [Ruminococcus sp.]